MRDQARRLLEDGRRLTITVVVATLAFHLLYVVSVTHEAAEFLLHEDNVVEWATFFSLFAATILGLRVALRARRAGTPALVWGFFLLFAVGVFVVAMEEISWGQWVFFWKTPGTWKHLNEQGETNLHNLPGLWGRSEWLRLMFAGGALVGVWADRIPRLRPIATPRVLTGYFAFTTVYVLFDLVDDLIPGTPWILTTFSPMSEWVEMLIGFGGLAYFVIKTWDFPKAGASADARSAVASQKSARPPHASRPAGDANAAGPNSARGSGWGALHVLVPVLDARRSPLEHEPGLPVTTSGRLAPERAPFRV